MKKILLILFLVELAIPAWVRAQTNVSSTTGQTVETIVCVRHGEKPPGGLGQLNCRGLNRSLALPDVLLKKFGVPQFIFAPNPTEKVDGNTSFFIAISTYNPPVFYDEHSSFWIRDWHL